MEHVAKGRLVRIFSLLTTVIALGAAPAFSPMSKLQWRGIGPAIGGRVVAVAGVPSRQNLFYMGAVDGGIWKSTDYGLVWTNISDGTLPSSSNSIGAIAVAPSNLNVIYAGSGESDIRGDVVTGDGMYRSTDAGKTWQFAGLRDTFTISAIAVDPRNANVVYASSMGHVFKDNPDRGVFKTTDGGRTWHRVLFVNASTGAIDLVMDPHDPNVLYATMWQAYRTPWKLSSGGPGSGLYKTVDGGAQWTNITRNPGLPRGVLGRMGVAVSASNPRIVYLIAQAKEGGVFRSSDAGATWTRVNSEWKLRQRAFYYMSIYVDPTNPSTVYVPNVDALWVSRDGGKVYTRLRTPHGDNHIVWINPRDPKILLEGNDGGATVSTDGGETWSTEHNQPTGQFYHVAIDGQFPFHVYGAQQDEGSIEGPSASSRGSIGLEDWRTVAYGESTFVAPQPDDPNVTYGSGYFSIFMRYDASTGQFREISPWPYYQEGSPSSALRYRFGWTHPVLFSPVNPNELLIGSQYVLASTDQGQTWEQISPDLTRNDPATEGPTGGPIDLDQTSAEVYPDVESIAVSPLDGNVIWAGSADGLVHVTTDHGAHWQTVTPPELPQRAEISSIEASHTAKGTAYLSASRYMWDDYHPYVYQTTDYGAHWRSITSGLPADQYVFAIRQDPSSAKLLFIGTKNTVYVSLDGGEHWQPLSLNLPRSQVRDIAIDVRQGEVVVATHGRAFWILDNLALLEQIAANGNAQLYAPQSAWLTHVYGASGFGVGPASGANPPFGATVFFHIPSSYDGKTPVSLSFLNSQGQLVRSFALHVRVRRRPPSRTELDQLTASQLKARAQEEATEIEPGMNRLQWDLRYPDAAEVTGYNPPVPAGGLADDVNGPQIVPGTYTAVLDYGGQKTTQSFSVALDPRLHAPPEALSERLALGLQIHTVLDQLDRAIDQAIAVRDELVRRGTPQDRNAADALDRTIADYVDLRIGRSSEGGVIYPTRLRDHLAYLGSDVDLAYEAPTPAQYAVFRQLKDEANAAQERLIAATTQARKGGRP